MPDIAHDELTAFATALLESLDAPPDAAEAVAGSLVAADCRGHASHGVIRIPWYAAMIGADELRPEAVPDVSRRDGPIASVDGNRGFGQLAGRLAVEESVSTASAHGVGLVGVSDATHLGRIGEWAERAAAEGMCFAAFVNTQGGTATVAPPGSARRTLATNPIAFGIPAFGALDFPLVLDIATSQVAHGKIKEHAAAGSPLPAGWTVGGSGVDESGSSRPPTGRDASGDEPVRDADAFAAGEGALLPLGGRTAGYKGFGLALVVELLAAIAGDGVVAGERESPYPSNAACFAAFDPTRFTTREAIARRVSVLAEHVREAAAGPPGPGASGNRYLLPGEPEHRAEQESRASGVALSEGVAESLRDLAAARGVGPVPTALADHADDSGTGSRR